MQVIEYNWLNNQKEIYEGSDKDVKQQIFKNHPWILHKLGFNASIEAIVKLLDRSQSYSACISSVQLTKSLNIDASNPQFHNKDFYLEVLRAACEFLSGIKVDDTTVRAAILRHDGDDRAAMLDAHNIMPSKDNLEALDAVLRANLTKSEDESPIKFNNIKAFNEGGTDFALAIKRASDSGNIKEIKLKGKHSKGTLLAKDPENHTTFILKPGSGKQNPAMGEYQNPATQSRREAAFYACASLFELKEYLPECHLLLLDEVEFACMAYLSDTYKNGNDLKAEDPNIARRVLSPYLVDGTVHKWAAMDYILGNPDRNSGNIMFSPPEVKLIDHGSTLCGEAFSPPIDKYSFVPYYLRAFTSGFKELEPHEKLLKLPRINIEVQKEVESWLNKLNPELLSKMLFLYDIDPKACIIRLNKLKLNASVQPVDMAINGVWVLI
jgi:hypothetical protein